MSWYKKADAQYRQFVDGAIENALWLIQIGDIENIDQLIDHIKTEYRANVPSSIYDSMSREVYERLKDELV